MKKKETHFSRTIRAIAGENINVSALSRKVGIERTFLYKMINGSRKVTDRKDVYAIAMGMMMSEKETEQLAEAYYMDQDGPVIYKRRQMVKDILEEFSKYESAIENISGGPGAVTLMRNECCVRVCGKNAVMIWTKQLLNDENACVNSGIKVYIQPTQKQIMDIIYVNFGMCGKKNSIQHLICMDKHISSEDDNLYNLECIKNIIPLLLGDFQYDIYIYYETPVFDNTPLPYYLVTQEYVMLYSAGCDEALVIKEENVHSFFNSKFDQKVIQSRKLVERVENFGEELDNLSEYYQRNVHVYSVLQKEPCFGNILTPGLIKRLVRTDCIEAKKITQMLTQRMQLCRQRHLVTNSCFTEQGLQQMLCERKAAETRGFEDFYRELTDEDVYHILKNAVDHIEKMIFCPIVLKSARIHISERMSVNLFDGQHCVLLYHHPLNGNIQINIEESSIVMALQDFMDHLMDSEYAYSREESQAFFTEALSRYGKMCGKI